MQIDEAIDRVRARLRQEGVAVPDPPAANEIAAVEAELAPLRLPTDYRGLIARMGPAIPLMANTVFHGLAFNLDCWRGHRRTGLVPRVLFTIAYMSHTWLAIELESDHSPGGELYYWTVDGELLHLGRLPALLASLAQAPATEPANPYGQVSVAFDVRWLGTGRSHWFDVEEWPEHWQRAEGLRPGDLAPAGATATVADVLTARDRGVVHERVHVSVAHGTSTGEQSIVTIEDDTGSMVLRWPAKVRPAWARVGDAFELEIRAGPSLRSDPAEQARLQRAHQDVSRLAVPGEMEALQEHVARLLDSFDRQEVDGEVIAARRLR